MRRNHAGIGGWRNEGPRHFRPRGGGTPQFRPGRGFGYGDPSRFQPPGPRPMLGPRPYHNVPQNEHMGEQDRGYRGGRQQRYSNRNQQYPPNQGPRQMYPLLQRIRHEPPNFPENQNFYEKHNPVHMNSMGDIDHRQSAGGPPNQEAREPYNQHPSPWINPPFKQRSPTKQFRNQDEHNKLPQEYQGHRPPASDHYGSNQGSTIENSNTFSRSVDDTVNIVRERLLSRESQLSCDTPSSMQSATNTLRQPVPSTLESVPEEQPAKKKSQRTRNIKTNCDKIKNKIVNQLFKMDKDKIHKLMDNPNSSTKFEYAISSLITESQNSYNRHLRSVAEKSLGTSSEFLNNDNNTIYEDTFMKQMQTLLDPQDTILLEDMKPMVLAELCKVLQLDEFEQRLECDEPVYSSENQSQCSQYANDFSNNYQDYEPFSPTDNDTYYERKMYVEDRPKTPGFERSQMYIEDRPKTPGFERSQMYIEDRSKTPRFERSQMYIEDSPKTPGFERSQMYTEDRPKTPGFERSQMYTEDRPKTPGFERSQMYTEDKPKTPGFERSQMCTEDRPKTPRFERSQMYTEDRPKTPGFERSQMYTEDRPKTPRFERSQMYTEDRPKTPGFERSQMYIEDMPKTPGFERSRMYTEDRPEIPGFERSQSPFSNSDNIPFERRESTKIIASTQNSKSFSDNQRQINERKSMDYRPEDKPQRRATHISVFDPNADHFSDDEDPFAELDKQYHVAVDHNFIDSEYISSPSQSNMSQPQSPPLRKETPKVHTLDKPNIRIKTPRKPPNTLENIKTLDNRPEKIKQEINVQLKNNTKSPIKFISPPTQNVDIKEEVNIKPECVEVTPSKPRHSSESKTPEFIKQENIPKFNVAEVTPEKSNSSSSSIKASMQIDSRKRSSDQRPSHRKEKRKKSESSPSDSIANKQILNKNIIINVNDCAKDCVLENRDAPKSVFNLFFSKKNNKESSKDNKRVESNDKGYSDKYVKRKENTSISSRMLKDKDESKKKSDASSSSHSMLSPTDANSASQTAIKNEVVVKLKPIDMFGDQFKKSNIHHAPRNTASVPEPSAKSIQFKPIVLSRKLTKRHVATQVVRKILSKEVQTEEIKICSTRLCQTDRKRLITRGAQTDSVYFKTQNTKVDPLERMKQIDMEIQTLLQEKFKLYSSIENQESCPNTMQSLGMAVLNPVQASESEDLSEDTIVDDFTNIPVEELEQMALESVQQEPSQNLTEKRNQREKRSERGRNKSQSPAVIRTSGKSKRKKKASNISHIEDIDTDDRSLDDIVCLENFNRRHKSSERERNKSQSPASMEISGRSKRKTKAPNISLIEQIITDDRPLEEIISLDDFEDVPLKTYMKTKKKYAKKEKDKKAIKRPSSINYVHEIKECSVVLKRENLEFLLKKLKKAADAKPNKEFEQEFQNKYMQIDVELQSVELEDTPQVGAEALVEETVNDIPIDMLDVSEDIVIGEEVKIGEKESDVSAENSIILDNSQPPAEDASGGAGQEGECRTFDYSSDENLRRDSITVTGNGDAVLAIECIENNFIAACLDGNVYYFSGDGQLLNTLRGSNLAVTCLAIVKERYGTTVYTGSLDSRIRYYDLETGLEKGPECNVLSPIQTMDRAWGTIFVGTRTGFVLQFECKNNMLIPVSTVKFSEQSILALRAMKEGPRKVLLVAARSEAVTIKDAQTGLLLRTLEGPNMTVYTLLFEDGKVYCGTSSHQIHVFDYACGSHVGCHEGGKGAVCLRATGGLVFAGCYDGCVYVYRDGQQRPLAQLRGPSLMLLSLAVHSTKIIAGYKDRSLYIWKIPLNILQEMVL